MKMWKDKLVPTNVHTVYYYFVIMRLSQGQNAMEVFMSIGMSPKDVDMLYLAFWDIDADSSGEPIKTLTHNDLIVLKHRKHQAN